MKLNYNTHGSFPDYRDRVAALEAAGYDTLGTSEVSHDPFVSAAIMAERTCRAEIMTGIAVAFARTPMVLAMAAHELNLVSAGRFHLGLGSQVKAHITRRFAMPWSHPARRMRELIQALHAIWDCWYDGKPLDFRGEFYSHTLMTPYFTPPDTQYGRPRVHLAAVGGLMTEVAAECADGLLCHSFTTERYVREVTIPAIEATLVRNGRPRADFELTGSPFLAVGDTEEALAAAIRDAKEKIAFYGSTPAYRGVLDLHGWGALHEELHAQSKRGAWDSMTALIDDNVFDAFALAGTSEAVAVQLRTRFAGLFDRLSVSFDVEIDRLPALLAKARG